MNKLFIFTFFALISNSSMASPLLERQLFNSLNGESYSCIIHDDGKTELFTDNGSKPEKTKSIALQPDLSQIKNWISELKKENSFKTTKNSQKGIEALTPEKSSQYVQRGSKEYFIYDGKTRVAFYKIKGYLPNLRQSSKDKPGNLQYKLKNYQQLKGATDLACKMAM